MKYKTLNNPPIIEALFDIKVNNEKDLNIEKLSEFQKGIITEFPTKEIRTEFEAKITLKPQPFSFYSTSRPMEVLLKNKDNNKLKPYEGWDTFVEEAQKHWRNYIKLVAPISINRVALRYINQIEIPLPIKDLQEYIKTVPVVAEGIHQSLSDLLMKLRIPSDENTAIVTLSVNKKTTNKQTLSLLFDIDVFIKVSMKPNDSLSDTFNNLRELKNTIFFKSLTEKSLQMYK